MLFLVKLKIACKKIRDSVNSSNGLFKSTNRFWLAVYGLKSVLALSVERLGVERRSWMRPALLTKRKIKRK